MTAGDRCPTCGGPTRPASLFLDPLPPPAGHDHEIAPADPAPVFEHGAPPATTGDHDPPPAEAHGHRRVAAAVVLAVLLVAGATVASLAGGTPDRADTAADTTTTERPTTTTRRRPVTTRTPTATTLALAPLPDGLPAGVLLFGTPSGRVFRADLATGHVERMEAAATLQQAWNVGVVAGNLVAALPRGVIALSPDDLAVRTDLGAANTFFVGGERLWLVEFSDGPATAREVRFDATGTQVGRPHELPPAADVRAATARGLVIQIGGDAFLYDPEQGGAEPLPGASILAAGGDRLARMACDRSLACHMQVSDLAGNPLLQVTSPEGGAIDPWATGSFSPDGSRLWVSLRVPDDPPAPMFVDVDSGAVTVVDAGISWQGNGAWLGNWGLVPTGDGVVAVGPGGEIVPIGDALGLVQWVVALEG